jgi:class 3 adenylate cyclase
MPLTREARELAEQLGPVREEARPKERKGLKRLPGFLPKRIILSLLEGGDLLEEGERRPVAVMFSDLCGSVSLTDGLGAEGMNQLLEEMFQRIQGVVDKYAGVVERYIGDAVMALFGAPTAHGDDWERAVRASIEIRDSVIQVGSERGLSLNTRGGIAYGEVVLQPMDVGGRLDFRTVGDAANMAARLQVRAGPGEILVSDRLHRLIKGAFETEALPSFTPKGKTHPVVCHRVIRATKASGKATLGEKLDLSVFVGRGQELATLVRTMGQVREGAGHAVLITGDAGVGKSRLVYEFYHREAKGNLGWYTGRCSPFGASIPFEPVAGLLRRMAGIETADSRDDQKRKLGDLLRRTVPRQIRGAPPAPPRKEVRSALRALLGLDSPDSPLQRIEPRQRRERMSACLGSFFLAHARSRPTVYVFEDIHWADTASLEFLDSLMLRMDGTGALMLLLARPTLEHSFPPGTTITEIHLSELDSRDSSQLIRRIMGTSRMPKDVAEMILSRTGGNPYFVEEVIVALREQGIVESHGRSVRLKKPFVDAQLPDTLGAVILSRLDRLEARVGHVIKCASVIGREFRFRLLSQVCDIERNLESTLGELETAQFIVEKSAIPELEYVFRHALTQEVAYDTLLAKRRALYHRRVAQALEQIYPDRIDEFQEMIAHHYYRGGAGEEARAHLSRAAQKCRLLGASSSAIEHTEQLLDVLVSRLGGGPELAEAIGDALLDLGRLNYLTADYATAEAEYLKAVQHAEKRRLRRHRIAALRNLGVVHRLRGRPDEGAKVIRRALRLCRDGEEELRAGCHLNLGVVFRAAGDLKRAQTEFEQFFRWANESSTSLQ